MVSSIVNMVVFVCVHEGDDHIMSANKFLIDNDIFVHASSKFMKKVDATSI
jgi:hypothetical protein